MRNNQDRMASPEVNQANPPVEFIVPTELIELPSKGKFYEEGHPLRGVEKIEMRHMTTKQEDILMNDSYLKDKSAINRMLQSVIVDSNIDVNDMLVGDKNALTVACRMYGYGPNYETRMRCPACGTTRQHTFDLRDIKTTEYLNNLSKFDAKIDDHTNTIELEIPRTKTILKLKVLKESSNPKTDSITDMYKSIIYSVNGNNNSEYISSYVDSMTGLDSRFLRDAYSKITPTVNFKSDFTCKNEDCKQTTEVNIPLNAEFFWVK